MKWFVRSQVLKHWVNVMGAPIWLGLSVGFGSTQFCEPEVSRSYFRTS